MICQSWCCNVLFFLIISGNAAAGETPSVLLQKGIYQEESAGNLDQAMQIYKSIVDEHQANRSVAAQAFYRLGECYAKKGDVDQAVATFQQVVTLFPDQKDLVARAQKRAGSVRQNLSESQVARLVEKSVKAISTRPEGDPVVAQNVQAVSGLNESITVKALATYLASDDPNVRRSAIYILWRGEFEKIDSAIEPLTKLCKHEEDLTRGMAALALGARKCAPAYDALADMALNDKSSYARRAAAYALGLFGDPRAVEVLEKAARDSDSMVAANAQAALKMIRGDGQASNGDPGSPAPNVIKTEPAPLATDVDPALAQITVTFDQAMLDGNWSWTGGGETFPKITGKISYDAARTTCRLPVQLEAGKAYCIGINSPSHQNFKNPSGTPAIRYMIAFATRSADGKPTELPAGMVQSARQINDTAAALRTAQKQAASAPAGSAIAIANRRDLQARKLIDPETLQLVNKYEQSFSAYFRPDVSYENASPEQRAALVQQWIQAAGGGDRNARSKAIGALGTVRAPAAVEALMAVVRENNPDNRPRWLAVRSLGRIGDARAVPMLIDLVDHGNENVRVFARLALAQITGVYYGADKARWKEWKPGSTDASGRIVDKIDYPFEDDAAVLGEWESVDFVNKPDAFQAGQKQWKGSLFLKQISFLAQGKTKGPWRWTKGLLIHPDDKTAAHYEIKDINGTQYLFVEWKSGDYVIRHQPPKWYVLQKAAAH